MRSVVVCAVLASVVLALVAYGCAVPAPVPVMALPEIAIGPPIDARTLDGSHTYFAGQPLGENVVYDVTWDDAGAAATYQILAGDEALGEVLETGGLTATHGFVMIAGRWPYVRTNRVSAGATGSTLLVQIFSGPQRRERIFFIEGDEAFVIESDGTRLAWTDPDIFQEVSSGGLITERRLSQTPDAQAFVDDVLAIAAQAGID